LDVNTIQQLYGVEQSTQGTKRGELGKDDFLQLLITQMRYQDPLEPVKDTEYIAQLAQFNSLEQMQNLNKSIDGMHEWLQVVQSGSMIGKEIEAIDFASGEMVRGTVAEVIFRDNQPQLVVGNNKVSLADVLRIFEEEAQSDG